MNMQISWVCLFGAILKTILIVVAVVVSGLIVTVVAYGLWYLGTFPTLREVGRWLFYGIAVLVGIAWLIGLTVEHYDNCLKKKDGRKKNELGRRSSLAGG